MERRLPVTVGLALRAAWGLVGVIGLTGVLMAVFYDQVVGSWASRHDGASQAFAQGGREGLERAGFVAPAFLPVTATMLVVAAMLVLVLGVFFREGHRWGQLGLTGLALLCVFGSVVLGFVLAPPAVFVAVAVLSLLVEGVLVVCLWHPDTLAYLAGPWADDVDPADPADPADPVRRGADEGGAGASVVVRPPGDRSREASPRSAGGSSRRDSAAG